MPGVRAPVEERGRVLAPERLAHPAGRYNGAQRHVPRRDSFRAGHEIRRHAVSLTAKPLSEPSEARDHLVADDQDVALATDPLDLGPVALRRRDHTTRADHRLADERGGAVAQVVERRGERSGVVVGDLHDVADQGPVPVADGRDP